MKKLILAEKPSVARDIARVVKAGGRGEGCLVGDQYVVTWAIGHLVSLCEPDEIDPAYKKWRMDALPILPEAIPTKVLPNTKSQYEIVKKLLNGPETESVICATDSGREGELIFRYIYNQAGCRKPVERLWISSMTDAAIRAGFDALKPAGAYDALYASARCRSEADWLVGMNASRAFTLRYDALLPVGRVQTPTLALLVARDREIADFVPQEYYEVRADFGTYQGLWVDPETNETRCRDKALAAAIKKETTGQAGRVSESLREKKRTPPPLLYDLTSLQQDANKKLGFSADKTLNVTQSLYEKYKLVTYPRTDSRFLPTDMIPKVSMTLKGLPAPYDAFVKALSAPFSTSGRIYNNERISDHHAIVPTDKHMAGVLPPDEARLFDLIARRFIAVHYPDYEYESAKVTTVVGAHSFRSTGSMPLQEGWRSLYRDDKDAKKEDMLPVMRVGDMFPVKSVSVKAQKTKPPAPLNDATLLNLMENAGRHMEDESLREQMKDSGLGTPATRAATIERLLQVGYAVRKGKTIISTEKGKKLIDVVPAEIASATTTGKWERALSKMAQITDEALLPEKQAKFLGSIRRFSAFLVDSARKNRVPVVFEREERRGRSVKPAGKSAGAAKKQ